jgi:hypothetical protein
MVPKMLGESIRGRHIQSTEPPGETSAVFWPSERNPWSAIGTTLGDLDALSGPGQVLDSTSISTG